MYCIIFFIHKRNVLLCKYIFFTQNLFSIMSVSKEMSLKLLRFNDDIFDVKIHLLEILNC